MSRNSGSIVVFEGPDGVGKTALHTFATEYLQGLGMAVESLAFPGNRPGTLGSLVYKVHHGTTTPSLPNIAPEALQTLHVAAHLDALRRWIHPAIQKGATVLLDRSWWSTWAYGVVDGLPTAVMDSLVDLELEVWGPTRPTATLLVRRQESLKPGHDLSHHRALAHAYERLADSADHPVFALDNEGSLDEAQDKVKATLVQVLDLTA